MFEYFLLVLNFQFLFLVYLTNHIEHIGHFSCCVSFLNDKSRQMPGTTGCPVFHSCTVSFFQSVRQSTGIKKFFHCILIFKGYDRLACFLKNFLCMAFLSCQTIHFLTCRNFFIRSFDQIHMINEPVELTY